MVDHSGKLREVSWHELCPWLVLIRSVRIALMARVLVLGALGLIATTLGWWLISSAFSASDDPVLNEWRTAGCRWAWESSEFTVGTSVKSADELFDTASSGLMQAPVALWLHLTRPFIELFRAELTLTGFVCLLLCGVWELLVWGLFGGAISRIAALKFTRGEAPDIFGAVRHSGSRLLSYSMAPLVALAGAAVFAVQLLVLGWIMHLSFLAMLAGLIWPFVLMLGLLMAILLIGALVGWPLMWSTVSVEGTDAFDALSRGYAYTYQRPLRLLWYVVFAFFLAALSMFVVKLFAASAASLGDWSVSWGLDEDTMQTVVRQSGELPEPMLAPPLSESGDAASAEEAPEPLPEQPGTMISVARGAVHFWKSLLAALTAGYQAGFLFVAAVGVYLLLRKDIDGAEMDEVYVEQEQDYGMPTLEGDPASGVPEVSPSDAAQPGDTGSAADQSDSESS